jgi:trehalose-6-phosphate synthase
MLRATRMPLVERRARMQAMRAQIASSSIYDWSGKLLADMREVRQEGAGFWPQRLPIAASRTREVTAG